MSASISGMMIHGNILLSLTDGMPADFTMFYLIGMIVRAKPKIAVKTLGVTSGSARTIDLFNMMVHGRQSSP
ncbi:hypothetical protein KEJ51_08800 [Candidatus Bathyarchaeota archaeon]|nr:hypothetical protein [Candidatus Bathyarchaeota archaeon]MBS7629904.1 hypothetical protein [Candidatus Bathyarchaeota archaeon]